MKEFFEKVWKFVTTPVSTHISQLVQTLRDFFSSPSRSRMAAIIGIIILVIALPVTIVVLQQQTQLRQSAYQDCTGDWVQCGGENGYCSNYSQHKVHVYAPARCTSPVTCVDLGKIPGQCGYNPSNKCAGGAGTCYTNNSCGSGSHQVDNGGCAAGYRICCVPNPTPTPLPTDRTCASSTANGGEKGTCYTNNSCGGGMHEIDTSGSGGKACASGYRICCAAGAPQPWYDCVNPAANNASFGDGKNGFKEHTTDPNHTNFVVGSCGSNEYCQGLTFANDVSKDPSALNTVKGALCHALDPKSCTCNKNDSSGRAFTCNSGNISRSCGNGMFCAGPGAQSNLWPCIPDDEWSGTCDALLGPKGIHNTACIHAGQPEPTNYDQVHLNGNLPIPCYNGAAIPGSCWGPRGNTNLKTIDPLSLDFGVADSTISNYVSYLTANSTCISIIRNDVCTVACQVAFGTQFVCNGLCNAALGVAQWAGTLPYKAAVGGACIATSLTSGNGYDVPRITSCAKAVTQNLFSRVDSICKNGGSAKTCKDINKDWVCANSSGQCSDGYKDSGSSQNVSCPGGTKKCCVPSGSTPTPTNGGGGGGGGGGGCTKGKTTGFALSIKLDGIGTGDFENNDPKHPDRTGHVRVFNTADPSKNIHGSSQAINHGKGNGKFDSAKIDLKKSLTCDATYKVEVKLPGYLPASAEVKYGDDNQTINLEPLPGDINRVDLTTKEIVGDGKIGIEDYSIYKTCLNQDPTTPIPFKSDTQTVNLTCGDLINFFDFQDGGTMESVTTASGIGEWDANYNLWLRSYIKANGF